MSEERREWERLKEMEREGKARLGSGRLPKGFWEMPRPEDPEGLVRKALEEDREGSW